MRFFHTIASVLLAAPLAAQTPRALTADDYARAERFLAARAAPLVTGLGVRATWLPDGRFWYRASTANGSEFVLIDPAKRTRMAVFDQARIAQALSAATGGRVEGNRLPFQTFELSKDSREITVTASNRRWKCDIQTYQCAPVDTTPTPSTPPRNSSVSPD
ncbi:MAG TPA: hypothetical protein VIF32_11410, partial [Gemmatimonadaceae bacterium]